MDTQESKKVNLEDLSKEDLLKKCKTFITLAQKAKASKEYLQEEYNNLKKQLDQSHQCSATNEVLERLTEEKLLLVSQIEDLKLKNRKYEDKVKLYGEEISSTQEKLSLLETENTSYLRQVKRLTDENEQLITDLSTLEAQIVELHKLGIQQKSQLLELEKSNEDNLKDLQCSFEEINKLNVSLKDKAIEISDLSQELQALKIIRNSSLDDKNKNCHNYIKEINELKVRNESYSNEILSIQGINEKLRRKVTLYHSKLKKFALATKEIKEEKNQVIKIFKAYTEQITEWKEQLLKASNQLIKLSNHLENENEILKNERECLQEQQNQSNEIKNNLELCENELQSFKDLEEAKIRKIVSNHNLEIKELNQSLFECKVEMDILNKELALKQNLVEEALEFQNVSENEIKKLNAILRDNEEQITTMNKDLILKDEALKEINNKYETKTEYLNKALIATKEDVNKLNEALKQSTDMEKKLAKKSSEEILRLVQSNKELEEKYSQVQQELNTIKSKSSMHNFTQTNEEAISQNSGTESDTNLKRENSELLLEMNQMNEALKERGETISKLEAHCEEIKKKLQVYESQASRNVDSITEKEKTIRTLSRELDSLRNSNTELYSKDDSSKDVEISNLKAEIEALKDKCNSSMDTSCYAESEVMSTSTISRNEDVNRLKELEGSWEERYGKLRTLAIKLKAKIREQGNIIMKLEKEREDLLQKQSNTIKTVHNLQTQIDHLQDDLERVNGENKQYLAKLNSVAESISMDKQLLVVNEETISKLNKEIEKLTNDKQVTENWKKQVSAKVQTLRKELEAKNLLIKEFENKISKLEEELESKLGQLKGEQESHRQTKSLLDQTNNECKKNSVLNLEMQDYERSVKELSQRIEKQKSEISNLQSQLDMQKNTVNALREQNNILEERMGEEEKTRNSTSVEINTFKRHIANLEELLQQKEDKVVDMTKLVETTRSENEELSTELSKLIAEHQKSLNNIKTERDHLRSQISSIQQILRDTQDMLKLKEDELSTIKEDYETYKVRAQSVLKKNQNRDLGLEEKLSEEVTNLKTHNTALTNELKYISEQLENSQNNKEMLRKERDDLLKKTKELQNEVEELKNYSEQLGIKQQKTISEHAETVRNLKVHAETLSQCYRQQLSEQEVRHNREIIELQSRIEKAPSPVETAPILPNMPREEGEGSESIESNPPPNNVHPIPLERLLDSKYDNEVMHLKKLLLEQESKVVHLTALLSDTEQDLAKHVQMNKVLKEEIRRQQRSVEREKHAENLEYLKNIVLKFITLNNGDERTRLVPVLNTILKLSPEETKKLSMVAKGDPGIKGWASYLPSWSSPNKPQ